jgi:peptide-methionine (S)-S-oxide reductase
MTEPRSTKPRVSPQLSAALLLGGLAVAALSLSVDHSAAAGAATVPAASVDETPKPDQTSETAVLAGGCFWGVQGVFQHVEGVRSAVSGYAGGEKSTAEYETVSTGTTGHAESVKITYDPHKISYGRILQIYFSAVHNPTELNRQGPDFGTQYRSAIFPTDAEQAAIARSYIAQLSAAKTFSSPIVTSIEPDKAFYPAEAYHQDYLTLHPHQPYIAINDLPKVHDLQRLFPELYRDDPVLVSAKSIN